MLSYRYLSPRNSKKPGPRSGTGRALARGQVPVLGRSADTASTSAAELAIVNCILVGLLVKHGHPLLAHASASAPPAPAAPTAGANAWTNLLSGAAGAVLGAILAGVITWLVTRSQTSRLLEEQRTAAADDRQRAEQDYQKHREAEALAKLLPVLSELQACARTLDGLNVRRDYRGSPSPLGTMQDPAREQRAEQAYAAMVQALHVNLPLITSDDFRQQYRDLTSLIEQLVRGEVEAPHRDRAEGDVIGYIRHVRHCVKNMLLARPLPDGSVKPPDLNRPGDGRLWKPAEVDPEDVPFRGRGPVGSGI